MKKSSLGVAAAAVALSFSALVGTSASAVASTSPGQVTTTQQITSTSGVVPVKGDFDGDGRDDVFWYAPGSATDYLWSGKARDDTSGTTIADRFDVTTLPISGQYSPIVGDFNGDDRDDILWYSPGSGPDSIWYFTGRGTVLGQSLSINGLYKAVVGDFDATDGIGADDIFWYNNSSSYLWTSNANETFTSAYVSNPPDNAKVYVGNFYQSAVTAGAPEYLDVLFYVPGTSADSIWAGNGDGGFTPQAVTINGDYNPIIGNFDANTPGVDMTDIFWYGPGSGPDSVWMNNGKTFTTRAATVNGYYSPMVVPSHESTTQDDIFWDSKTAGDFLWVTNGTNTAFSYTSMTPSAWGGTDIGQRNGIPGDYNKVFPTSRTTGQLSVGWTSVCAVTTATGLDCWGGGSRGVLGNGATADSNKPVAVSGLSSGVASVSVGYHHACAVTTLGAATCWGGNTNSQLGNGLTADSSTPVAVTGLSSGVSSIAAGDISTCAVVSGATVKCWGGNTSGQLGNGTTTSSTSAVTVTGLSGVTQISMDDVGDSVCAVAAGGAKCWGDNTWSQLGNGNTTNQTTPVNVTGLTSGVAQVSVGTLHACAVTTTGGLKCWGNNSYGQLGNGTTTSSATPVDVTGLTSGVASVNVSHQQTCALLTNGTAKCWGQRNNGTIGDGGANTGNQTTPVTITNLQGTGIELSGGMYNGCVLNNLGRVQCWGYGNLGDLGDGTNVINTTTPTEVIGGRIFSTGASNAVTGNADVLWYTAGDGTGEQELLWYDLDSLS